MQREAGSSQEETVGSKHPLHFWSVYIAPPQALEKQKNPGYFFKPGSSLEFFCESAENV